MDEKEFKDWDTEYCDNCECVLMDHMNIDGTEEKWVCVGTVPKPHSEDNVHDLLNKIQICIKNENSPTGCTCHQWTPYEAQTVSVFLASAIARLLYEGQITPDELKKLRIQMKIANMNKLRMREKNTKKIPSKKVKRRRSEVKQT